MAWLYLTPLKGGAAEQMQGICEAEDDLAAAASGAVDVLGRTQRTGIGSLAYCMETGTVWILDTEGNWQEVKS